VTIAFSDVAESIWPRVKLRVAPVATPLKIRRERYIGRDDGRERALKIKYELMRANIDKSDCLDLD
jgi:hypothetical protein